MKFVFFLLKKKAGLKKHMKVKHNDQKRMKKKTKDNFVNMINDFLQSANNLNNSDEV